MSEQPAADLSTGTYDEFETAFSQKLGLKVMLVGGWDTPGSYHRAEADVQIAASRGDETQYNAAKKEFEKAEAAMLAQLRAKISGRDAALGAELSDNDLRSLRNLGHVTLRHGNTEPEQAVLIFDPKNNPFPKTDPVLRFALTEHFANAWDPFGKDAHLPVKDFLENFNMAAEDKRRYQAVTNVHYALQNQSEFNNMGKGWYDQPFYFKFAQIDADRPGLWKDPFQMPYADVVKHFALDRHWNAQNMGIKDENFLENVRLAGAIMNLNYSRLDTVPFSTFARTRGAENVPPQEIVQAQRNLRKSLEEKLTEHRGGTKDNYAIDLDGLSDWRILFPIFREVYEADKSTGAQRLYYDTIMQGLQKFFPALTNGPVPDIGENAKEPSRSLPKPKAAKPAATLQP